MGLLIVFLVIKIIGLLLFAWILLSIKVAKMDKQRVIGYYRALFISLIFSPLIGWSFAYASDKKDEVVTLDKGSTTSQGSTGTSNWMIWVSLGAIFLIIIMVWLVWEMLNSFHT